MAPSGADQEQTSFQERIVPQFSMKNVRRRVHVTRQKRCSDPRLAFIENNLEGLIGSHTKEGERGKLTIKSILKYKIF